MDSREDSVQGVADSPVDVAEEQTDLRLHTVTTDLSGYIRPYKVMVRCYGVKLCMEIDTGAALSIISESLYWSKFKIVQLQPCDLNLRAYTDQLLKLSGKINVRVQSGARDAKQLTLLVSRGKGPAFVGRDWIRVLNLDWSRVYHLGDPVEQICAEHKAVFSSELGCAID